jgi:polyhydroxybutyrate depolymerase
MSGTGATCYLRFRLIARAGWFVGLKPFAVVVVFEGMTSHFGWFVLLVGVAVSTAGRLGAGDELTQRTWTVDGVPREALVHFPTGSEQGRSPVVFVFHGHSGTMRQAAASMPIHRHWPEAIVIYAQGLPTPGLLTDREGRKPGWQAKAGAQDNRDLRFFDVMLADLLTRHRADASRIYATGHSNGGGFTYLLWAERVEKLAAVAPSAAVLPRGSTALQPLPVLHLGSPGDPLVRFRWQERMIDEVLKVNGCGPRQSAATGYTRYPSSMGTDVATYLHDGGHRYPEAGPELIVKFFKEHSRRDSRGHR